MSVPATPSGNRAALVLSGGGAAGAYEVGVMKALFGGKSPATGFRKLDPEILVGTSVGAMNASFILSCPDPDLLTATRQLEHIYLTEVVSGGVDCKSPIVRLRASPSAFFNPRCYIPNPFAPFLQMAGDAASLATAFVEHSIQFFETPDTVDHRLIGEADFTALLDTSAFRQLIGRYLDPDRMRATTRNLILVATNWENGAPTLFTLDDLTGSSAVDIVVASAALPIAFPQAGVKGHPFADGGIVMNSALAPALHAGAREMHLVYVDPNVSSLPISRWPGTAETAYRSLVMALAAMVNHDLDVAQRINLGLAALNRARQQGSAAVPGEARDILYMLGAAESNIPADSQFHQVTVHRYIPNRAPGGAFRWLNFSADNITETIELGYRDTIEHDCARHQCIIANNA